jgi:hypothetical protein
VYVNASLRVASRNLTDWLIISNASPSRLMLLNLNFRIVVQSQFSQNKQSFTGLDQL